MCRIQLPLHCSIYACKFITCSSLMISHGLVRVECGFKFIQSGRGDMM
jgi:hypothetical protein